MYTPIYIHTYIHAHTTHTHTHTYTHTLYASLLRPLAPLFSAFPHSLSLSSSLSAPPAFSLSFWKMFLLSAIGWQRFVENIKTQVSFEKEPCKSMALLQKRPEFSRSLHIVATSEADSDDAILYMYKYIYKYIYIYICTYIYYRSIQRCPLSFDAYMYIWICIYRYIYTNIYIYIYTNIYIYIYIYIYMYIYLNIFIYKCIYIHIYTYTYIYVYV